MSNRWSMLVVLEDLERGAERHGLLRHRLVPSGRAAGTPNNLINTEPDGKIKYTDWSLEAARHLGGAVRLEDLADAPPSGAARTGAAPSRRRSTTAPSAFRPSRSTPAGRTTSTSSTSASRRSSVWTRTLKVGAVHRRLQRVQRQSRTEPHLGLGHVRSCGRPTSCRRASLASAPR